MEYLGIKKYAVGKIWFDTKGPAEYIEQAREALNTPGVCDISPFIHKDRFEKALRNRGIPEDFVPIFLENIGVDDEHCLVRNSPEW